MTNYIWLFCQGIMYTLLAWTVTGIISLLIGCSFGILSCNYLGSPSNKILIRLFTFIAKGIPAYVQILIAYFIIPTLLGINIPAFLAACLALAFCSAGYVTEIVRSGINSIPIGQWDACKSLNYPMKATLKRIILPQMFKNVGPSLFGELEQLLKSTSLFATIGITELTRTGMNIISRELNPIPVYLTVACIYLLFSAVLNIISMSIERRFTCG